MTAFTFRVDYPDCSQLVSAFAAAHATAGVSGSAAVVLDAEVVLRLLASAAPPGELADDDEPDVLDEIDSLAAEVETIDAALGATMARVDDLDVRVEHAATAGRALNDRVSRIDREVDELDRLLGKPATGKDSAFLAIDKLGAEVREVARKAVTSDGARAMDEETRRYIDRRVEDVRAEMHRRSVEATGRRVELSKRLDDAIATGTQSSDLLVRLIGELGVAAPLGLHNPSPELKRARELYIASIDGSHEE